MALGLPTAPPRDSILCGGRSVCSGTTGSPFSSYQSASPVTVKRERIKRRFASARSRAVKILYSASRAARRPPMPQTSVTGVRSSRPRSASGSSSARAPNGLAVSEISLASVLVRATPTVTGTPTARRTRSRISSAVDCKEWPGAGTARKKNSSME